MSSFKFQSRDSSRDGEVPSDELRRSEGREGRKREGGSCEGRRVKEQRPMVKDGLRTKFGCQGGLSREPKSSEKKKCGHR